METQEITKPTDSRMSFVDYGDWHIGKEIISVRIGRPDDKQAIIGSVRFDYDANVKRAVYRSFDANGKELYAPNYSLPLVKRQFKKHEDLFIADLEKPIEPVLSPYAKHLPKEKKRSKKLQAIQKGKNKSKSRTR